MVCENVQKINILSVQNIIVLQLDAFQNNVHQMCKKTCQCEKDQIEVVENFKLL